MEHISVEHISIQAVLRSIDGAGSGNLSTVSADLGLHGAQRGSVEAAMLEALTDGLIEGLGADPETGEVNWRLTQLGHRVLSGAYPPGLVDVAGSGNSRHETSPTAATAVSVADVLDVVAGFEEFGGANVALVCWELSITVESAATAWERALADGLLEPATADSRAEEALWRLSEKGRAALPPADSSA